jgi:class 3 adenylate cyclase
VEASVNAPDAVTFALEMRDEAPVSGLPPLHTGIAAGPLIFQDGDYFGRTVNTAARIASHAGPGEVWSVTASRDPVGNGRGYGRSGGGRQDRRPERVRHLRMGDDMSIASDQDRVSGVPEPNVLENAFQAGLQIVP